MNFHNQIQNHTENLERKQSMAQATVTPQDQQAEYFSLLSGHTIPAVGLGTWKSGSKAGESVFTAIVEVLHAYNCSFRHVTNLTYKVL